VRRVLALGCGEAQGLGVVAVYVYLDARETAVVLADNLAHRVVQVLGGVHRAADDLVDAVVRAPVGPENRILLNLLHITG